MNLDNLQLPDLQLPDTVKRILLPALLGAAGTGAAAGYFSSQANNRNELPSDRRKRIIRNALIGSVLGGTAGAAIPAGIGMLRGDIGGDKGFHPLNAAWDKATDYALPGGAGLYGGYKMFKSRQGDQTRALAQILDRVKGRSMGGGPMRDVTDVTRVLDGGPSQANALLSAMRGRATTQGTPNRVLPPGTRDWFSKLQLLQEGGLKGYRLGEHMPGISQPKLHAALKQYLLEQSILPESIRKFSPSGAMSSLVGQRLGGKDLTGIPEWYLRTIRPAVRRMSGIRRFPAGNLARLGTLGAMVYGAQQLQDALTSQ